MKSFEHKGIVFTAHGQTPDLYEELYGSDCDIFADFQVAISQYAAAAKPGVIPKALSDKISRMGDAGGEKLLSKLSGSEADTLLSLFKNNTISIGSSKKLRQIIVCLIMQTRRDAGDDISVPMLMRDLDMSLFTDPVIFTKLTEILLPKKN